MGSNKEASVVDLSYFRFLALSSDFSRRATMLAVLCEEVGRAQLTPNGKGGTNAPSAVEIMLTGFQTAAGCLYFFDKNRPKKGVDFANCLCQLFAPIVLNKNNWRGKWCQLFFNCFSTKTIGTKNGATCFVNAFLRKF